MKSRLLGREQVVASVGRLQSSRGRRRHGALDRSIRPVAQALEPRLLLTAVSWVGAVSGSWDNAANWSNAAIPTAADDVTISVAPSIVISCTGTDAANSLTTDNAIFESSGSLTIGTTLTLNNFFELNGGSLIGATVIGTNELITTFVGTLPDLQNVTLNSDQTITDGTQLSFEGSLTLNNANLILGSGTGGAGTLATDSGTLGGTGTVIFAAGSSSVISVIGSGSSVVNIGPNVLIRGAAGTIQSPNAAATLNLQGTVSADTPGQTITINAANVVNTGIIQVVSAATLQIQGAFPGGAIFETNSTLNLNTTLSDPHAITRTNGTINLIGALDLAGGSATFDATTGSWDLTGGIAENGTLNFTGGAQIIPTVFGGTFQNITLNSGMTIPDGAELDIRQGLTLNAAGKITLAGSTSNTLLVFKNSVSQTLGGTGQVVLGGSTPLDDFFESDNTISGLQVGPGITISGAAGTIETINASGPALTLQGIVQGDSPGTGLTITGSNVVNTGTIRAITGGRINLATDVGQSGFVSENNGTLDIDTQLNSIANISRVGGTVNVEPSGVLNGLGSGTFTFDANKGSWNLLGTVVNAALTFVGGNQLVPSGTTGTLFGVTLNNDMIIPDGAQLNVINGLTLANNASITLASNGNPTKLLFTSGSQTLGGAGAILFGGTAPAQNFFQTDGPLTVASTVSIKGTAGTIQTLVGSAIMQILGDVAATSFGQTIVLAGSNIIVDGNLEALPGTIATTGNFQEPAVGTIVIGIGSSGSGQLNVNGSAALAGTLNITLLGGFVPPLGTTFNILTYTSQTGSFATVTGLTPPGVAFTEAVTPTALNLTTISGSAPTAFTDLTISSSTDTAGTYVPGNVLIATATENAAGAGSAGPFSVQAVLSQDSIFGNADDIVLQTIQSSGFTAAGSAVASFQATIPATAAAGAYRLLAEIDSSDAVAETDETNNIFAAPAADIVIAPAPVVLKAKKVGGLDPNFGNNGIASHSVGLISTADVALQSDGKSVIVGAAGTRGAGDFGVTRFNADGSVDTTFGTGGLATTDFAGRDDRPVALSILPDGRILVVGTSTDVAGAGSEFALARYNADGSLDTTFGNGAGKELISFAADPVNAPSLDIAHGLAVRGDGVFFVAGSSQSGGGKSDFAVAAFNPDGSLSTAFNGSGKVLTDFAGGNDAINAITLQGSSLVAVGSTANPSSGVTSIGVVRYLPSGALDSKFGAGGKIITSLRGVDDEAASVAIGPKGVIVVGGLSATGSAAAGTISCDFALVRYTSAGKIDKTFGAGGRVITSFRQPSAITKIIVAADGSVTASGKTVTSLSSAVANQLDIAIARYTAKGALDRTFNGTGQLVVSLGQLASAIVIRPADLTSQFNAFTQTAQGVLATTQGGALLAAGTAGTATVVAVIVTSGADLSAVVLGKPVASVIGGAKGTATVQVTNAGTILASGTVSVSLFASPGPTPQPGDALIRMQPQAIKLTANKGKAVKFSFNFPKSLVDGNYFLVAQVNTGGIKDLNATNNIAASNSAVRIAKPFVDLSGRLGSIPGSFPAGKKTIINVTVTNNGNEPAKSSTVQFLASPDKTVAHGTVIGTAPLALNLKQNSSKTFKESFVFPATLPAGSYFLLALLDPSNVLKDPTVGNNLLTSATSFVVG